MGDNNQPGIKRVRLTGTRFEGGRLPIDSLTELQKYQDIVRLAALAEWKKANPGRSVPEGFVDSISLTIESLNEGSADVFLAFEQHQEYVLLQKEAQDAADAVIVAAYSGSKIPVNPAQSPEELFEFRAEISQFGQTLKDGQTIEFYPETPDAEPISISIKTRDLASEKLLSIEDLLVGEKEELRKSQIQKDDASLVGKVTALDTDKMYYRFTLPDGQQLKGYYKNNPELLDDLREVVNDAADGPLTRITGALQNKDGNLFRFWETTYIEQIQFDETAWGARLTEFASLAADWDGADAPQISSVALDAAQTLLRSITEMRIERPGVFPTLEGGVLLEWGSATSVVSIELLPEGNFESFSLFAGQSQGQHAFGNNLDEALQFIRTAKI